MRQQFQVQLKKQKEMRTIVLHQGKGEDTLEMTIAVSDEEYERRLDICKDCDKLNAGTCMSCGCYVEIRAAAKISKCPTKKW